MRKRWPSRHSSASRVTCPLTRACTSPPSLLPLARVVSRGCLRSRSHPRDLTCGACRCAGAKFTADLSAFDLAQRTLHVFVLVSEPEPHFNSSFLLSGASDVGPQDIICLSRTKLDTTFPYCPHRAREFFTCNRNIDGFTREYCEVETSIDTPLGRVFYVRSHDSPAHLSGSNSGLLETAADPAYHRCQARRPCHSS